MNVYDFDGTIYRLFANYDLKKLVNKIYTLTRNYDIHFTEENDAFDAFGIIMDSNISESVRVSLLEQIQKWFIEEELKAVGTGIQVEGFLEFLQLAKERGIVFNVCPTSNVVLND